MCYMLSISSDVNYGMLHIGLVPYKSAGKCMVCTCIAAYAFHSECSRCLREVLNTHMLGFLINNGMPPANIFDNYIGAFGPHCSRGPGLR